jgi:translation initiation factor IF-2
MTAERVRIYEVAKKLNLSNKEVMDLLEQKLSITAKSHSSTIDKTDADKLETFLSKKPAAPTVSSEPKTEIKPVPPKEAPIAPTPAPTSSPAPIQQEKQFPPRPQGDRPQGDRPQGGFPPRQQGDRQFPPRPQGDRPQGGFPPRQYGDRQFPPRPQGDRPQGDRPQGGFPPRQQGDRQFPPRPQGDRPQGGFPPRQYGDRQFPPRPQGDRPQGDRPQGGFPPRQQGDRPFPPRPQGDRPQGGFPPRQYGDRQFPPRPQGDRPQGGFPPRPSAPAEKPEPIGKEGADRLKSADKKEFSKKKDKIKELEDLRREKEAEQKIQAKLLKKKKEEQLAKEKITEVYFDSQLTVGELAEKIGFSVAEVIKELMMSGIMATVNQTIDTKTAKQIAEKFELTVIEKEEEEEVSEEKKQEEIIDKKNLKERAPIVTIMGHVDHGKTTLLDSIRKSKQKIVSGEFGGITQSIGAYTATVNHKKIVFIDTPGHEAFTAMRARGAQTTDIVVLVVAADDGIMPQTIEAINHAKAAKVPIIIAVNKIDKPGADPDKVLQQLTEYELVPEKWGGSTITVEVSALQSLNIDELLDYILLVAEVEELKANPNKKAKGVIIEAKLDKGKGAVATFLVLEGTLKVGDFVVAGTVGGKVRALIDDSGDRKPKAGPSTPVEVLGLTEIPQSGDNFEVVESDKRMKEIIADRKEKEKISRFDAMSATQVKREMLLQSGQGETQELNIVIKAGTHGAAEAVVSSLHQLESKQIFVKVVHLGIGDITEADVMLASASNAIIIGFNVKEDQNALRISQDNGVIIRKYEIIYQLLEDIEKTMLGLLAPEYKEVEVGTAEVRQVFTVGKTTKIAGCYVLDGKIIRNKEARVIRNGKEIYKGVINQLKRFKEDAKEVNSGYECGISFDKFNDIEEGDIIKVLTQEEIERSSLV